MIAEGWADLSDGVLRAPIIVDEFGSVLPNGSEIRVWTSTLTTGTRINPDTFAFCDAWGTTTTGETHGGFGEADNAAAGWTEAGITAGSSSTSCQDTYRLYCFKQ